MARKKQFEPRQESLFDDQPLAEIKAAASPKRVQKEKRFMQAVMKTALKLGLPCIHISNFCGNRFIPECPSCGHTVIYCPVCKKPFVAHCRKILNRELHGHHDVIGIAWTIETKHKINKGKQTPKLDAGQQKRAYFYSAHNIPHLVCNEDDEPAVLRFLSNLSKRTDT